MESAINVDLFSNIYYLHSANLHMFSKHCVFTCILFEFSDQNWRVWKIDSSFNKQPTDSATWGNGKGSTAWKVIVFSEFHEALASEIWVDSHCSPLLLSPSFPVPLFLLYSYSFFLFFSNLVLKFSLIFLERDQSYLRRRCTAHLINMVSYLLFSLIVQPFLKASNS